MIVKIIGTKPDPGGLIRYLFGRGTGEDLNLHENQRTIAGTTLGAQQPGRDQIEQIANDLRAYQRVWGTAPKAGHIQHIIISLNPGDRPVTDEQWRTITEDYLTAQGITAQDKAAVRWVAVNHGRNAAGADHIHIALSLVRSDGTLVNTWQEKVRSQRWAQTAERRYNLTPLESRAAHAGHRSLTRGELAKARAAGREPLRVRLADIVRPIAAASSSEVDYIQRLRAEGLDPRPRITNNQVTGYSVAAEGQRFGGGTLAPELRLPALRRVHWNDHNTLAAQREWQHPTPYRPSPSTPDAVRAAIVELEQELWRAPVMTTEQHRAWSAQAAGLTAAAAAAVSDPTVRAELNALSRDLGRWAGGTSDPPAPSVKRAAQIVAAALSGLRSGDEKETAPDAGALMDTLGSVVQIAQMHRATRPAIAAQVEVTQHAQAQQISYARRTLNPGYYRTNNGVIRIRQARAGHCYAATRTADGTWKASGRTGLLAALGGQRMTPTEVGRWEQTRGKVAPASIPVPVQPDSPRASTRRRTARSKSRATMTSI